LDQPSRRKQAEDDSKSEGGQVKQALANTRRRMEEKNYRTTAEMVLAEFPDAQRNKQGEYTKALPRILLGEELRRLFEHQRKFGNPHASTALEAEVLGNGDRRSGLFWAQKPALAGEALLGMVGRCTFEKDEYRAPKASFTAERHVWLPPQQPRIVVDGEIRPLNTEERKLALPLPYRQASDLSYRQLASALVKAGLQTKDGFKFAGLAYPSELQKSTARQRTPRVPHSSNSPPGRSCATPSSRPGWKPSGKASLVRLAGQPERLDKSPSSSAYSGR
jgi:CRISPR-associated endonuclease Csn1